MSISKNSIRAGLLAAAVIGFAAWGGNAYAGTIIIDNFTDVGPTPANCNGSDCQTAGISGGALGPVYSALGGLSGVISGMGRGKTALVFSS